MFLCLCSLTVQSICLLIFIPCVQWPLEFLSCLHKTHLPLLKFPKHVFTLLQTMWKVMPMKPSSSVKSISSLILLRVKANSSRCRKPHILAFAYLFMVSSFHLFFFLSQRFNSTWPIKSFLKCSKLSYKSLALYILYYWSMEQYNILFSLHSAALTLSDTVI